QRYHLTRRLPRRALSRGDMWMRGRALAVLTGAACALLVGCSSTPIPPTYTQTELKAICERRGGGLVSHQLVGGYCQDRPAGPAPTLDLSHRLRLCLSSTAHASPARSHISRDDCRRARARVDPHREDGAGGPERQSRYDGSDRSSRRKSPGHTSWPGPPP